jgi:hypothetical protein
MNRNEESDQIADRLPSTVYIKNSSPFYEFVKKYTDAYNLGDNNAKIIAVHMFQRYMLEINGCEMSYKEALAELEDFRPGNIDFLIPLGFKKVLKDSKGDL